LFLSFSLSLATLCFPFYALRSIDIHPVSIRPSVIIPSCFLFIIFDKKGKCRFFFFFYSFCLVCDLVCDGFGFEAPSLRLSLSLSLSGAFVSFSFSWVVRMSTLLLCLSFSGEIEKVGGSRHDALLISITKRTTMYAFIEWRGRERERER